MPLLELTGVRLSSTTCQAQRTGRLLSPSSPARRSTSSRPEKAVSVKCDNRMKPKRTGAVFIARLPCDSSGAELLVQRPGDTGDADLEDQFALFAGGAFC